MALCPGGVDVHKEAELWKEVGRYRDNLEVLKAFWILLAHLLTSRRRTLASRYGQVRIGCG